MADLGRIPAALRRGWQRTSLRARLIGLMVVLVAVAMLVTSAVGTRLLRGQLIDQVDERLAQTVERRPDAPPGGPQGGFDEEGPPTGDSPSPVSVQLLDASGNSEFTSAAELGRERSLPDVDGITAADANERGTDPFTVGSTDGDGEWRVTLRPFVRDGQTFTRVLGVGLGDTNAVVAQLQQAQLLMGLIVLLVLAGIGAWLVRLSLKPLSDIERTAEAIGAGDLSQRVPDADPRTEVGHLAGAINGMLGQIEASARQREASEQEARASEQRMRRFLDDASHELRTPLTSIRGFSELYRRQQPTPPEEAERLVARIESEATRMGGLLEDMLLLARLDHDRPVAQDRIDLVPLLADAAFDLHTLDPDRPVELDLPGHDGDVGAAGPEPVGGPAGSGAGVVVIGDEARLRQVLGNLVRNVRVHTPPDTPVHLRAAVDSSGAWGVLDIADEGPGLSEQDADRVFERFYRADPARARATGGSGLGLTIVASIIHALDGHVRLDTAPGRGARFLVYLPLAEPSMPADEAVGAAAPGSGD